MSDPRPPIRALHVAEGAAFAGIETHLVALADSFSGTGVSMRVAAFSEGLLTQRLRDREIECVRLERRWKFDPAVVRALAREAESADVVHSHGYLADVIASSAAKRAQKPHVVTAHGKREPFGGIAEFKMSIYMAMDARAMRRAARVVAVSEDLLRDLRGRGVPESRLRAIANGLPDFQLGDERRRAVRAAWGANAASIVVGFVGRFDAVKAPMRFVDIAAAVKDPRAVFVMAGDGPLRGAAEMRAAELGIADRVRFPGFIREIDEALHSFDVLLMPSDSEGVPQALLAAMRAGIPAVCSRVGGIPEILDGFEELTAAPEAGTLASCLALLLSDEDLRREHGARLRERFARRYSASIMAAEVAALYREVIS